MNRFLRIPTSRYSSDDIPAFGEAQRIGPNTRPVDMPKNIGNARTVLADRRDAEIMLRYMRAKVRADQSNKEE